MATSTKTTTKAATKAAAKPVAKAPTNTKIAASSGPSLRFYHSQALGEKTNEVLSALEKHPSQAQHAEAIADLVNDLIEAGMDYYFLKALKAAEMGFVTEQSARLGMSGAVKLISSVSRKFITRMDQTQLLVVATHIRTLSAA